MARIGDLLIEFKIIDNEQLQEAVAEQKKSRERLGLILIKKGYVTVEDLEYLLSRQHALPALNLEKYNLAKEIVALVPEKFMKKNYVVPVELEENTLTVAMANPHDYRVVDELRFLTGKRVTPVISSLFGIKRKLRELFPTSEKWEDALGIDAERQIEIISPQKDGTEENLEEALESAGETPIVKMVNSTVLAALDKKATHAHVIPREGSVEIKLRINGVLEPLISPPKENAQNLVNRIKVLAGIDILKRRVPLAGYFRVRSEDQFYDIDVATFPVLNGEQVVLTFQQPFSKEELRLDNIGMTPNMLKTYNELTRSERGLILVLGPPDSGKTSTIYATLNALKDRSRSSVTYENPIKNRLVDINQAEPNEKAGVSFASGLKALLKQDIDYLMVGEAATSEVLQTLVEASLGKTLVLARMTYNHSIGAIIRLIDQGVAPFMLYTALRGIVGQRLVRRLCPNCLESFVPPEKVKEELTLATGKKNPVLYKAVGCKRCGMTGYRGRIGVFELLIPDDKLRSLILARAPQDELTEAAVAGGFVPLQEDGLIKAVEGMTTYEEIKGIK